jgi:hypothetical protein
LLLWFTGSPSITLSAWSSPGRAGWGGRLGWIERSVLSSNFPPFQGNKAFTESLNFVRHPTGQRKGKGSVRHRLLCPIGGLGCPSLSFVCIGHQLFSTDSSVTAALAFSASLPVWLPLTPPPQQAREVSANFQAKPTKYNTYNWLLSPSNCPFIFNFHFLAKFRCLPFDFPFILQPLGFCPYLWLAEWASYRSAFKWGRTMSNS